MLICLQRRELQKVAARLIEYFNVGPEADGTPQGRTLAGFEFTVLHMRGPHLAFVCTHDGTTFSSIATKAANATKGVCNVRWG